MTCRCARPQLVSHAGWWQCRVCNQPIERHDSPAGYIAAMRARLHPAVPDKRIESPSSGPTPDAPPPIPSPERREATP